MNASQPGDDGTLASVKIANSIMNRATNRLRDLMDSGDIPRSDHEEFMEILIDEIKAEGKIPEDKHEMVMKQIEL